MKPIFDQITHYYNNHPLGGILRMLSSSPITVTYLIPLLLSSIFTHIVTTPVVALKQSDLRVLPLPKSYTTGSTILCLSPEFTFTYADNLHHNAPKDLQDAARRTIEEIWRSKHQYLSPDRGAGFFFSEEGVRNGNGCEMYLDEVTLHLDGDGNVASIFDEAIRPVEDRVELERYTLSIPLEGSAEIRSKSTLGLYRGLTTFQQLFYHLPQSSSSSSSSQTQLPLSRPNSLSDAQQLPLNPIRESNDKAQNPSEQGSKVQEESKKYAPFAPYEIDDKPAFGWRAVLLDTSRNYFGVEKILGMLDTMSLVKVSLGVCLVRELIRVE
jgi:hexosaminidase